MIRRQLGVALALARALPDPRGKPVVNRAESTVLLFQLKKLDVGEADLLKSKLVGSSTAGRSCLAALPRVFFCSAQLSLVVW